MRKNHYESTVIINAALEDTNIEATISRIKETITSNGGEITNLDNWGRKRLAYPIQKSKSGYYVIFRIFAPVSLIATLERAYRLDETIIRFLTISLDTNALEHIQKLEEKGANEPEEVTAVDDANDVPEQKEEKNN